MKRASIRFTISRVTRRRHGKDEKAGITNPIPAGSEAHPGNAVDQSATRSPAPFQFNSSLRRFDYSLLITDDDAAFRETLRSIFEPEGFQTLLAHSGEEALNILGSRPVHLAILDQHMPRLTGLETLRIIRQRNTILPVILMTADNTQQLMRDALSAHAFCVMSKSVTRNVVVYTVQQALSRSYEPSSGLAAGTAEGSNQ